MRIESVAVFCGSKPGSNPVYIQHATELGRHLALLGIRLVYGGGKVGLMGAVADAVLQHGGTVMGVIPRVLTDREVQHQGVTELAVVPDMHSRKKMMYDMSDAAIILAGGMGTLDELFEMVTWNQLKIHDKKIFILNSGGFYDHLYNHLRHLEKEDFLYEPVGERLIFCQTPVEVFNRL
ncbi:MAG: TIGR00730 family Rossman fold protein [Bacteroidetes bacterium]|nr:TIGR00730 family Rossman fold protein [Bacteroidota bacterium]